MEQNQTIFGLGERNPYGAYFIGQSYLNVLSDELGIVVANVTFEKGCRNNWHIHQAKQGGGQILLVTNGEGWYQEEGKNPRRLKVGDVVSVPPKVKHWHGATKDSIFSHITIEVPGEENKTQWCNPVSEEEYNQLEG